MEYGFNLHNMIQGICNTFFKKGKQVVSITLPPSVYRDLTINMGNVDSTRNSIYVPIIKHNILIVRSILEDHPTLIAPQVEVIKGFILDKSLEIEYL